MLLTFVSTIVADDDPDGPVAPLTPGKPVGPVGPIAPDKLRIKKEVLPLPVYETGFKLIISRKMLYVVTCATK